MIYVDPKILERVNQWLTPVFDLDTQHPIKEMIAYDPEGLEDSFYRDLEFGTGEQISDGVPGRRDMAIVIADCEGKNTGQTELPILGLGCYFILQEVKQKGNESEIYGEFVEACAGSGNPGPVPANGPGPRTIQLYKDISSIDS